jgi:hypothetical protein
LPWGFQLFKFQPNGNCLFRHEALAAHVLIALGLPSVAVQLPNPAQNDPNLARLVDAWPALLDKIRRSILALVQSAGPPGP